MASLKAIRKRISSVKSTQKITRAMKMVAGARLNRAQQRILELRPYAMKTQEVLSEIVARTLASQAGEATVQVEAQEFLHPLLAHREEKRVMLLVLTSDRGLCGAFNANINKAAEREYKERTARGQEVRVVVIGRKGRDYLTRRNVPVEHLTGVWDKLSYSTSKRVGEQVLLPFLRDEVDAIYLVYNEFKSAISQKATIEQILPIVPEDAGDSPQDFIYEPNKKELLARLLPMYVTVEIFRAILESVASEHGARMTAMDNATRNASELVGKLTLDYNRARQAAITKELMEIIGGAEALKG